ncbi:NusG domain II-containing protein [Natronospora cellulosivora (SeqCode)]
MEILKKMTFYDKALIIVIVLLSLLTIIFYPVLVLDDRDAEKYAVVEIENQEIHRYHLDGRDRIEEFTFTVDGEEYIGRLEIEGERVRLQRLSREILPLAIHADTGWIENQHQIIVALPVRLTVQIVSEAREEAEFDGISY